VIKRNEESVLDFKKGIQSVIPASKKNFEMITAEYKELETGFKLVQKVASTLPPPPPNSPVSADVMAHLRFDDKMMAALCSRVWMVCN